MIGIIGQGFVGNAVYQKFKKYYHNILTYDLDNTKCNSSFVDLALLSKIIFVCLPTPMNPDGSANVSIIEDTLSKLNEYKDKIIVIKSTIPPSTTERFNQTFKNLKVAFNPEFLTERNAVSDYENQNRIILGGPSSATTELKRIFSKVFPNAKIIKTDSTQAELVKYLTNTFLSVKISFANEIYQLCQKLGIDYDSVVEYATYDERLGNSHWSVPGHDGDFGFGGHCFPKDLNAILYLAKELGIETPVLSGTWETNKNVRTNKDWESMKGRAVI
jgi:UDPglucose 6-dehydrogenase